MSEKFEQDRLKELMSLKKTDIIKMYAKTLNHLRNIVDNLGLWKCPKCGNWAMEGHVCYECRYDPSYSGNPDNNPRKDVDVFHAPML